MGAPRRGLRRWPGSPRGAPPILVEQPEGRIETDVLVRGIYWEETPAVILVE